MRRYLILFIFIFAACKNEEDRRLLEKQEDIKQFYTFQLKKSISENEIIIILQNQQCVACRRDIFSTFYNLLAKSDLHKEFIMEVPDTVIINHISHLSNSNILFDTNHKLTNYGLDYGSDLCLYMKDGKLKKWFEISNDNLASMHSIE